MCLILVLFFQERQAKLDVLLEEEKGILARQGVSVAENGTHAPEPTFRFSAAVVEGWMTATRKATAVRLMLLEHYIILF